MRTRTIDEILAEHPLFRDLDREHRRLLAGCGATARFDAGAFVFREGEPADRFYVIRAGGVALEIHAPGRGPIVVQTLGPGDVLGWSWLFPPYRWRFDARATAPTAAIAIDGACLRAKCDADAPLARALLARFAQIVVARLQATRLQLVDVYGRA